MKLFTLVNGNIVLNNIELLLIKEFEALIARDNSVGKIKAFNEFKFIYLIVDPLSKCNLDGYNEKQAVAFATNECSYPSSYVPDRLVEAALVKYAMLRSTLAVEVAQELLISIKTTPDVLKKIRNRIDALLEIEELTLDNIKEIRGLQKEIIDMANGIPDLIKKIVAAQKEIETIDVPLGRGKIAISDSMDPSKALG